MVQKLKKLLSDQLSSFIDSEDSDSDQKTAAQSTASKKAAVIEDEFDLLE